MKEIRKFLDTNILVYAYDKSAGAKYGAAQNIVLELWDSGLGVISTQVLQEFFVITTEKIPKPLKVEKAKEIVQDLMKWTVIVNDNDAILESIKIHQQYKYSFWDSMIIQAAVKGGAKTLVSEDLSAGQIIRDVEIKNPFLK